MFPGHGLFHYRNDFECFSVSVLEKMTDMKFLVLGLLLELVEEANENYTEEVDWMKYHAKRRNMIIQAASIQEIAEKRHLFKDFVVFFDDLIVGSYSKIEIFIRNIIRAAGLICIVSGSNTDITGAVDQKAARDNSEIIWSIAITELDYTNRA